MTTRTGSQQRCLIFSILRRRLGAAHYVTSPDSSCREGGGEEQEIGAGGGNFWPPEPVKGAEVKTMTVKPKRRPGATIALLLVLGMFLAFVLIWQFLERPNASVPNWTAPPPARSPVALTRPMAKSGETGAAMQMAASEAASPPAAPGSAAGIPREPMLISTASMRLRVASYETAEAAVRRLAGTYGGFVSDENAAKGDSGTAGAIAVRVPAKSLDRLMTDVGKLGQMLERALKTEEVTEEYVDLQSRLRNSTREEERLLELFHKAGKVSDLLEVEQTLAGVRESIEQITGRLRYLENRVSLATLTVNIEERTMATAPIAKWAPGEVARRAVAGLLATLRTIATMLIWIGAFAPIWVAALIIWWVIRRRHRRTAST